jgi:hypothetical protein
MTYDANARTVKLTPEAHQRAEQVAQEVGLSLPQFLPALVEEALKFVQIVTQQQKS